ncbi:MAG: glycosyltransferase, partial [Parahaliea sp.]
ELIDSGETGLLTPVDEVVPLADAIRSLLDDSTAARDLAGRARAHYLAHYSRAQICRRYGDLLQSIASHGRER